MAATETLRFMPFAPRSARGRMRKLRLIADEGSTKPALAEALGPFSEIHCPKRPPGRAVE
jgi:hypothetical protein